ANFRRGRHRSRHVSRLRRLSRLPADLRQESRTQRRRNRDCPWNAAGACNGGKADHRTRVRSGGANTSHCHWPPVVRHRASTDLPRRNPDALSSCSAVALPRLRRSPASYQCAHRLSRRGAARGVFGTIWDIGEAGGPLTAGFLIGGLGYAVTFDVFAAVTAAVTFGLMALVRDPKRVANGASGSQSAGS